MLLKNLFSFLAGGLSCACCGKDCLGLPLCRYCMEHEFLTVPFNEKRCRECGRILVSEIELCTQCRARTEPQILNGIFPLYSYRLWKKDLLYLWKNQDFRGLSDFFAGLIFKAISDIKTGRNLTFDAVVPVPPRPGKIKRKGWDQIDELCGILHKKYRLNVLTPLVRYNSSEQKKMTKLQRKGAEGADYGLKNSSLINQDRVLLVDDVVTTGATMEKCAKLIKKAGCREVFGISLFMVD